MADTQYEETFVGANTKSQCQEGPYEEVHAYASVEDTQPSAPRPPANLSPQDGAKLPEKEKNKLIWLTLVASIVIFGVLIATLFVRFEIEIQHLQQEISLQRNGNNDVSASPQESTIAMPEQRDTIANLQIEIASLKLWGADLNATTNSCKEETRNLVQLTTNLQTQINNLKSNQLSNLQGRMRTTESRQRNVLSRMSTVESGQWTQNSKISSLTSRMANVESKAAATLTKLNKVHGASIHLTGGPSNSAGRVEVFMLGEWGTVCDDGWGREESAVVCRQLGKPAPTAWDKNGGSRMFPRGSGKLWIDDVSCKGTESKLTDCTFTFNHNCGHNEDVGVRCG